MKKIFYKKATITKNEQICANINFNYIKNEKISIKISQLKHLIFIQNILNKNVPVFSIEYGHIARTIDLQKYNVIKIAEKIKNFCEENHLEFIYSTPVIISERDFSRVYKDIKKIIIEIQPNALLINNEKFILQAEQDKNFQNTILQISKDITIQNHSPLISKIKGIDLSDCKETEIISKIKDLPNNFTSIKYTIAGNKKIHFSEKCPLNDSKEKTGLFCSAPCSKNNYAIKNEEGITYSFITDGFCNTHFFYDFYDNMDKIDSYKNMGINEFIIDLSYI